MSTDTEARTHLHDGAYVKRGSWSGELIIFASNGLVDYNPVHLDETGFDRLIRWYNHHILAGSKQEYKLVDKE